MEYKFKLLKMHCAGCALALEQNLNNIEGVLAEINFVTKIIKLNITTDNPEKTLDEVKSAITKFDHMIEIVDYESELDIEKKEKREREINIIRLSVSAAIMIFACFIPLFWLKIAVFSCIYLVVSFKVLISAFRNILHGKIFDENFLMTIASIGAFIIGEYVEAISVMLLYGIGSILEDVAVGKSRKTIKSLLEIKQPYANLVNGEEEQKVALSDVNKGSVIRVKPGEKIPLDGEIIDGTSYLNMSALTGESKDQIVQVGDKVLSGSINGASVLLIKVLKPEAESTITRVVDMVEKATETKARSEKFISKFSKYYTPIVIALAFIIAIIPPLFIGLNNFTSFAYRALCFLVVSCPCALVISVPLTYFASIGSFARSGILVKGANYVEALSKVNSVVFDKTGTLTEGRFEISEICAFGEHTNDEILEIVAYAESFSNHRIARSVVEGYRETTNKQINTAWINGYNEIAGKGIKANIFMQDVLVGNAKLFAENDVTIYNVNKIGTVLYVSIAGTYAGYVVIDDVIKQDSKYVVENLKNLGINDISLCTGDEENVAESVAKCVGIKSYYSSMLPEDKVNIIESKLNNKKTVAFVGDGINDAPSLARSNVGISMGGLGSDIAVEASDVVIMNDEPSKVAIAVKKAKKTHKIVLQNIIGSIGIKVAILIMIAFGISGMWLAVFADVGVNILAVINSLRAMLK